MDGNDQGTARRLMEAFLHFHRLNWKQSPIAGIRPSELLVLFCIKRKVATGDTGIKVSEISNLLRVTSPTITQLINGLEAKGFVARSTDKEDRRAVRVKLTAEGESVIKKAGTALLSSFNGLVAYLGEEDSNRLIELLAKVFAFYNETRPGNF